MRILVLGGDGMLGHRCLKSWRGTHEVRVTLRRDLEAYREFGLFDRGNAYAGIDLRSTDRLAEVFADFRPEAVVNAAGIVKQRSGRAGRDSEPRDQRAVAPPTGAVLCRAGGARLVHVSTDCVFSGRRGRYTEADPPDAEDLYGRSKLLGEVAEPGCLTLRTSIIGRELSRKTGLLEWFLSQRGRTVRASATRSSPGSRPHEMARIIERLLTGFPQASGLYHVSAAAISKFDLLHTINGALRLGAVGSSPTTAFAATAASTPPRFRSEFGYAPPSWDAMAGGTCTNSSWRSAMTLSRQNSSRHRRHRLPGQDLRAPGAFRRAGHAAQGDRVLARRSEAARHAPGLPAPTATTDEVHLQQLPERARVPHRRRARLLRTCAPPCATPTSSSTPRR